MTAHLFDQTNHEIYLVTSIMADEGPPAGKEPSADKEP